MRALLFAAALAIPLAASAGTPTPSNPKADTPVPARDAYPAEPTRADPFSKAKVVQKIDQIGKKHVELGNLAKARGSSDEIRRFGNQLVKDGESLAKDVSKYAKDKPINLAAAPYAESATRPERTGTLGGTGHDETMPGRDTSLSTPPLPGHDRSDQYGQPGMPPLAGELEPKLSELRNLQGIEFDSRFLSNVVDGSERALTQLNGWKGQGDEGLDKLIDRGVKMIGDAQREALRLQGKIPAA